MGLITLDVKGAGARSAGNPHATCDVAGVGNGIFTEDLRASARPYRAADPFKTGMGTPATSVLPAYIFILHFEPRSCVSCTREPTTRPLSAISKHCGVIHMIFPSRRLEYFRSYRLLSWPSD